MWERGKPSVHLHPPTNSSRHRPSRRIHNPIWTHPLARKSVDALMQKHEAERGRQGEGEGGGGERTDAGDAVEVDVEEFVHCPDRHGWELLVYQELQKKGDSI